MTQKNINQVSTPESHSECIMCGNKNNLSFKLKFKSNKNGKISATFHGNPNLQGYKGLLHGGIISSLLDSAMTHCLFNKKIEAVTAELKVKFIKPVPYNSDLTISAWITDKCLSIYTLNAELLLNNETLAKADSKFMELKKY